MNKNRKKFDLYQEITNQIIDILENHKKLEYTASWTPTHGEILAHNPVSKHVYTGLNQLYLCHITMKNGYRQNRWITFVQGSNLGAKVKKGEKSRLITFWGKLFLDNNGKNVTRKVMEIIKSGYEIPQDVSMIPYLRYHKVFNIEQFEGLPENLFFKGESLNFTEPEKDDLAEDYLRRSGAVIKYRQNQIPCYMPAADIIMLPERKQYKGKEYYYSDIFHELGHWTGHSKRLNRESNFNRRSRTYAMEELIAELFSAFACAHCGFSSLITNNAAYIESWLKNLRSDKKFIFEASRMATQAVNFVSEIIESSILQPEVA